jgi:polyphosphate kinase
MTHTVPASEPDLTDPALYQNRELAWLEFNRRVLHEARDPRTPLLERVKFLAIFANNLDEFFQVRVSGVREQVAARLAESSADGMAPGHQLDLIRDTARELMAAHTAVLQSTILPALAAEGIVIHPRFEDLPADDRAHLTHWFQTNVFPVLTPLAVDPAHPFPHISNLSLSLAVTVIDDHGEERFARVKVPRLLPRWVPLPTPRHFLPLEQLIGAHLEALFPGVTLVGWHLFRITRNTDMTLETGQSDLDEADDLLELIQEEVQNRRFGEVVRLEVHATMPEALRERLIEEFNHDRDGVGLALSAADVVEVDGLLDATDLQVIAGFDLPALHDPPFVPAVPERITTHHDIFAVIREGDVLLHHPYDSFQLTVEQVIAIAADDSDVLAIKITLYRTDREIARLLAHAAERGKQVAVLIELQARFDEEANISWARRFEEVGVHVSYGDAGLKTHAKVLLIVRREGDAIRRYVHIGTGNYNPKTARVYTDFGLLTADDAIGADATALFNVLTGFAVADRYQRLVVAPRWLKAGVLTAIGRERDHALAGRRARILAKVNALVDPDVIRALYQASQAGVEIDLIVRGICCLRPGLPGVSDTIRVISIVGRFLEHSRAMIFGCDDREEVYISSADWMPRNLERRVEVMVPIINPAHRDTIRNVLELMLRDNRQAWEMRREGKYVQRRPAPGDVEHGTQTTLLGL